MKRLLPHFFALLLLPWALSAAPVINEFMAANTSSLADEDGTFSDWIEIYNPDPAPVNLAGYALTDTAALPQKWVFPSVTIAPGGYRIIFASSKNRTNPAANLHTNFQLSAGGEYLGLIAPGGAVVQEYAPTFPKQQDNLTYGLGRRIITTDQLAAATPVVRVPAAAGDMPAGWDFPAFTPTGWTTGTAPGGIGYDRAVAPPNLINTATTGTATQSSEYPGFPANLAIDGQNGNFTHTDGATASWWQLAWTADRTIHKIVIYNRADCCQGRLRDITVDILAADLTTVVWTSGLLNAENALTSPAAITVDVLAGNGGAPVTGRAVKIRRTADTDWSGAGAVPGNAHDAYTLSLAEVTVLIPDPNGTNPAPVLQNLAPAGTASQTSTLGGYSAALAIDGSTGNFTHTLNTDLTPAWTLNLGRRALISEIVLNNRGDGCCQFRLRDITVQILDADGTTVVWTSPLLNPENSDHDPQLLNLDVEGLAGGPVVGNYVRVRRTGDPDFSGQGGVAGSADDAYVISLGEVTVMGIPVVNYDAYIATDIETPAYNNNATALARWNFNVAAAPPLDTLKLAVRYDDGFVAYLNGVKVAERNAPASPAWNSAATINRDDALAYREEIIDISAFLPNLVLGGANVLAVQMLNNAAGDEDFLFNARLLTSTVPEIVTAYLASPTPGAVNNVGYFLGRVADTVFSVKRGIYTTPFNVAITCATSGAQIRYTVDGSRPTATTGLVYSGPIPVTTTTIIRSAAFKAEWQSTDVDTHTYIFPAQLFGSAVMNQSIMTNPTYQPTLTTALTSLPVVSLVLSGSITRSEKLTSMELIGFGDGDVQQDCGMAHYGGYVTNFAKESLRVYFRNEYGASKLKYPLFKGHDHDIPATDEFDALDLRNGSHDMVERGYYLSNPLCDDTLLDMGHLNPHGRFIHIMVNGQYWGVYHLRERWGASMHSQYLGGQPENYEAIVSNKGGGPWSDGLPYDGTGAFWNTMLTKRSDWLGIQPYIDTNQFLDFMLLFMSGDSEAEQRSVSPNTAGSGFKFYLNDADGWTRTPPDRTLNEGPNNIMAMLRTQAHPDYKTTLADRIQKHFFNGGAMTQAALLARHDARATQLQTPFVLEAARWGYRTVDSWVAAKNSYRNSILSSLTTTMTSRFKTNGLLPATNAPALSQQGGAVPSGFELNMTGTGTIYYTTNNTDPRLPGGAVSPSATQYISNQQVETLVPTGASWRYRDTGTNYGASDIVVGHASYGVTNWKHPSFNTESPLWSTGNAELGYGDSPVTVVGYGGVTTARYITTHFRKNFTVANAAQIIALNLRVKRDDGAIIYINGREAGRTNMTAGTVYQYNTLAPNVVSGTDEEAFFAVPLTYPVAGVPSSLLVEGTNVIAVELHQQAANSSDLSFDLELTATKASTAPGALTFTANSIIKARCLNGAEWSPLNEAFFTVGGAAPVAPGDVAISEIHYNPVTGLETEFVEITNISNHAVNLRGCGFPGGFTSSFPATRDTILAAGQRTVVARSLWDINTTYGLGRPVGALGPKSNLNNGGETLTLQTAALLPLCSVTYDNSYPWPATPDGTGPSLTLAALRLSGAASNPLAWRPSSVTGGTPGLGEPGETTFTGSPDADSNNNGYTNFQEYALAGTSSAPATGLQVLNVGGVDATYQTCSFQFNSLATDADVRVESSSDLVTWTPTSMVVHSRTDNANGTVDITFRSPQPFGAGPDPRVYTRITVRR